MLGGDESHSSFEPPHLPSSPGPPSPPYSAFHASEASPRAWRQPKLNSRANTYRDILPELVKRQLIKEELLDPIAPQGDPLNKLIHILKNHAHTHEWASYRDLKNEDF